MFQSSLFAYLFISPATLAVQETVTMANKYGEADQLWGVESRWGAVSVYAAMEGILLVKTIKEQSELGSINTQKRSLLGHDILAKREDSAYLVTFGASTEGDD